MSEQPQKDTRRKLRLWQDTNGTRVPVDIFTDEKLTILDVQMGGYSVDLKVVTAGQGRHNVRPEDPDVPGYSPFFTDIACWFDGCKELRAAYSAEVNAEQAKAESEGRTCLPCDLGDIRAKYIAIMRKKGYPLHPLSNASHRQAP